MKATRLVGWSLAALALQSVAVADVARPAPHLRAQELPAPSYLPQVARVVLRERMGRHGPDAVDLLMSVTLLRHQQAAEAAQRIANEPQLAEPSRADFNALNAALPSRFFVLQKQTQERARELAAAARAEDDGRVANAFARLTETCVSCHSVYLRGPAS